MKVGRFLLYLLVLAAYLFVVLKGFAAAGVFEANGDERHLVAHVGVVVWLVYSIATWGWAVLLDMER